MPTFTLSLEKQVFSRRSFLVSSVTGAAVLTLSPFRRIFANGVTQVSAVLPFVSRFAHAIGANAVAARVSDYLRSSSNTWLNRQINHINDEIYRRNWIDFSRSQVWSTGRGIFYPVVHRDGLNTLVVFHGTEREDPQMPIISGPTMVGLAFASEEIARTSRSQQVRQILYPVRTISRGLGNFEIDYISPDIHETDGGGRLTMDYRNDGVRRGIIEVLAEGRVYQGGRETLFHREYSITYT